MQTSDSEKCNRPLKPIYCCRRCCCYYYYCYSKFSFQYALHCPWCDAINYKESNGIEPDCSTVEHAVSTEFLLSRNACARAPVCVCVSIEIHIWNSKKEAIMIGDKKNAHDVMKTSRHLLADLINNTLHTCVH